MITTTRCTTATRPRNAIGKATTHWPKPRKPRAYIRDHRQEPFVLVLSWGPPHNPYETAPERFRRMFKADAIQLRANVPPEAQDAARRDLAGYYAHCAALDQCVGEIMATLNECNLADDTILVFTSDHGDMLGSHAQIRKQRPWDESILVPFLVRWPNGLGHTARRLSAPLSHARHYAHALGLVRHRDSRHRGRY